MIRHSIFQLTTESLEQREIKRNSFDYSVTAVSCLMLLRISIYICCIIFRYGRRVTSTEPEVLDVASVTMPDGHWTGI